MTLSGIEWTDVKTETVGLGWHEVGDVIKFTQGSLTVKAFIARYTSSWMGLSKTLVSAVPLLAAIDYQAAGGIMNLSTTPRNSKLTKQKGQGNSLVSFLGKTP